MRSLKCKLMCAMVGASLCSPASQALSDSEKTGIGIVGGVSTVGLASLLIWKCCRRRNVHQVNQFLTADPQHVEVRKLIIEAMGQEAYDILKGISEKYLKRGEINYEIVDKISLLEFENFKGDKIRLVENDIKEFLLDKKPKIGIKRVNIFTIILKCFAPFDDLMILEDGNLKGMELGFGMFGKDNRSYVVAITETRKQVALDFQDDNSSLDYIESPDRHLKHCKIILDV